jgi:predicted PurR-regulated permease PerM
MTPQLWIGFGFLALLVVFLIISFFLTPKLTNDQRATLKFLTALCAGFAGGFLTGSALFEMHMTKGATTFSISGAAGCALFFTVWFFYPKIFTLGPGFAFSIPANWSFKDSAEQIAQSQSAVVDWQGFKKEELDSPMQTRALSGRTAKDALLQLRLVTVNPSVVRPYDVEEDSSIFRLRIR